MCALERHLVPGRASPPQNCNVFTCHSSISLFVIIFSPGRENNISYRKKTVGAWRLRDASEESHDILQGRKQEAPFLSFNWETKAKVIAVELELGKGRNNSWAGGYHRRPRGTKSGFEGFADAESPCLYCHVDFLSPNNHILSVFWSTPVLRGCHRI